MTKPKRKSDAAPYSCDLLSHAAGVTGRIPDQLKQVNQGYVHEHSTTTTITTVDIDENPVDSAVQLITDAGGEAVFEICLETQEAAVDLMNRLVKYPSVMIDMTVEIYYRKGDSFKRFRLVPHRSPSSSLVRAVETFDALFTVSDEPYAIGDSEAIDVETFSDRFQTWYQNVTGRTPAPDKIADGLEALFGQPFTERSTNTTFTQQHQDTLPRRWVDELAQN